MGSNDQREMRYPTQKPMQKNLFSGNFVGGGGV